MEASAKTQLRRLRWRRRWHWLVLAVCGAGSVIAGRLTIVLWQSAQDETAERTPVMLWGLSAACAVFALLFAAEAWARIRALRRKPPEAAQPGS